MSAEAWLTAAVVLTVLIALWREYASPSFLIFSGVGVLLLAEVITPEQALSGFSNPAPVTLAALFVVARAVSKTGAIDGLTHNLLGDKGHTRRPMLRLLAPTAFASGFIANTPLVAMLMPQVTAWANRRGSSPSRFLMPLSFGVILGGTLTLIGTSTNLVVAGRMQAEGLEFDFFETTAIGLPIAVAGLVVLILLAPRMLRRPSGATSGDLDEELRRFTIEMRVISDGQVDGRTVQEAGLRSLTGVFLVAIDRGETTLAPASPTTVAEGGDILRFVGDVDQILGLSSLPGIELAELDSVKDLDQVGADYFSVVVGADSPLVGTTLKGFGFRSRYQAAVIAIHRAGERIEGKLGQVPLHVGDTLLLIADPGFGERWQNRSDFLVVSPHQDATPPRSSGAGLVLAMLAAVIALAAFDIVPILQGSIAAAILLVLFRVLTPTEARRSVDLEVIGIIASAFGLAAAVETSGLADTIADGLTSLFGGLGEMGALLGIILATVALTELVTNNAAALLMLPIAFAAAPGAGVEPLGMGVAVAIASSASFLTPIGYQTNTMVYGPGGYRFSDYLRLGTPLTTIVVVALLVMIPIIYST